MFSKILIANRGEIACRVMRTCRRMGIATVAVYSQADAESRHVAMADEAYPIGPSPARQSYLRAEAILEAARRSGAQAVHPGYGFLSENADFAEACAAAGLVFIGPPPSAMRAMGSKSEAKALMQRAGVPLVPGYHGTDQDPGLFARHAAEIGYPVLVKASAGGGGKGMRVVEQPDALDAAIEGARGEAEASFGDGRLLIEKYLTRPRHIEIQVFADSLGACVHLFERDCSIQRRHQKVIEEAPAPHMVPQRRAEMGAAAVAASRAVGYVGAGTVEFIAEGEHFYFMEMNTRLQVEHPVTEMVTGQELVEWQLRVADGQPLPCRQEELALGGHAIEARLYAEDPAQDFRPSIGRISHLRAPRRARHVRIDSGVREGDAITPFYDPMIGKLIVWGADRAEAVARLRGALDEYEIVGVQTNLALLRAIAATPDFIAGAVDTGFIARHPDVLQPPPSAPDDVVLAAAAWVARSTAHLDATRAGGSPWDADDDWRLNLPAERIVHLRGADIAHAIGCTALADDMLRMDLAGQPRMVRAHWRRDVLTLWLDGVSHRMTVLRGGARLTVLRDGVTNVFDMDDALAPPRASIGAMQADLRAPLPSRIARILTEAGAIVRGGDPLIVVEAMKMEITLAAPADGEVAAIHAQQDEMVAEGALLVSFAIPA